MSARQGAGASPSCSGSMASTPVVSPAWGVAATGLPGCWLRVAWVGSAPAHTGAATVPPPSEWSPTSASPGGPAHTWTGDRGGAPLGSSLTRGGGSGSGGGRCGCASGSGS
eukprot:2477137-Pleurochrysis_carterae.AAC.1